MRILSGMRPTGRLHIGHLSVLENWVRLQEENECFYFISDWHALTTGYDNTAELQENIRAMLLDWLGAGLDPERSTLFVQSHVKEHAELHLLFSMFTPLSWLERVPTYKDQIQQLGKEGKDVSTYGFLGYPLLMAADILIYLADAVPVGEDQLPHLEFCREVARRFNHLYKTSLFPEPQALLAKVAMLPGIDGRKMSKSYHNDIPMSASSEEVWERVRLMITDPARIHKTDPGHPEVCLVHRYHEIYNGEEVEETRVNCRGGRIGCVPCKKRLSEKINAVLEPVRERRARWAARPELVEEILAAGAAKARTTAGRTMTMVREAMGV
ncbi:Tryptophan-tRNA ligase [Moorella glycerini]|uniref:Tryptophan--tRNA ligase n=1 Tax=Neomoorella stamsii TaxID=1266720 RepID=A0A9X7J3V9_9FIRM|nr:MULTISPECIES: tryptophan--tRNA ligase [Moorella]PRR72712.1 Tryptophan--tRNA ligase [Moorella stamsii]CEP68057.1 Tryptophan-tRNA ligase [Moorella glycerini]